MTVYVDNFRAPARVGRLTARWSHLVADTPEELHAFAASLGLLRSWFQDKEDGRWHYDVTDTERAAAIALGAKSIDIRGNGRHYQRPRACRPRCSPGRSRRSRRGLRPCQ